MYIPFEEHTHVYRSGIYESIATVTESSMDSYHGPCVENVVVTLTNFDGNIKTKK